MHDLLRRAMRVLETDSRIIAPALAAYRARRGISDEELAAWLGIPCVELPRLALCCRPSRTRNDYVDAVRRIAVYVQCDAERLTTVLASD